MFFVSLEISKITPIFSCRRDADIPHDGRQFENSHPIDPSPTADKLFKTVFEQVSIFFVDLWMCLWAQGEKIRHDTRNSEFKIRSQFTAVRSESVFFFCLLFNRNGVSLLLAQKHNYSASQPYRPRSTCGFPRVLIKFDCTTKHVRFTLLRFIRTGRIINNILLP